MLRHEKISINEAKSFTGLYLSGFCRCGKQFTVFAELPETVEVSSGGEIFKTKPAEHIIIVCPYCLRLVNVGNGSRRKKGDLKRG
ncbi:MAG: hypothetical protein QXH40_03855 [Candidatus Bathyarchaeia archaeon]